MILICVFNKYSMVIYIVNLEIIRIWTYNSSSNL